MSEGVSKQEIDELYVTRAAKVVQARPVCQQEYKTLFPSETCYVKNDTAVRGYLVKDFDPHRTITEFEFVEPDKFEHLYRRNEGLTFGDALELLRSGYCVKRQAWPIDWKLRLVEGYKYSNLPFFQFSGAATTQPWPMNTADVIACDWVRVEEVRGR